MAAYLVVLSNFLSGLAIASEVTIDKTVNDSTLMPGAAVEFVVTVRNTNDVPVEDVVVTDRLPDGLEIPEGVAPFATQGTYDAGSGTWSIGALAAAAEATLQIPASVTADRLPPCIVNRAILEGSELPVPTSAAAALRTPANDRCMELELDPGLAFGSLGCGVRNLEVILWVTNLGPDDARNVVVRLEPSPNRPPGFRFRDSLCETKTQCTIESLGAGRFLLLDLVSDGGIENSNPREFNVAFSATVPESDYNVGQDTVLETITKPPFEKCPSFDLDTDGGGGGGGGGGCFIATAAYGSAMHPHVDALREWRDRVLLNSAAGRSLVELYYRYSPPLADFIAERPELRAAARALLWPLVVAVLHPTMAGAFVVLVAIGLIARRRRQRAIDENSAVG